MHPVPFPKKSPRSTEEPPQKARFKKTSTSFENDALVQSLKASGCSEERIRFLEKFNDYARLHGDALLPITLYSEELDKALDLWAGEGSRALEDLFSAVVGAVDTFHGPSDKCLTLVRIAH